MAEWKKDIVHSCCGCPMYYNDTGYKNWPSSKHCGGDHYECDYFCNGGKPNVGIYAEERACTMTECFFNEDLECKSPSSTWNPDLLDNCPDYTED